MSEFMEWMAAAADEGDQTRAFQGQNSVTEDSDKGKIDQASAKESEWSRLAAHNFPARLGTSESLELEGVPEGDWDRDPDIWLYRKKTTALLRRYMRWSLEAGRVPSVLGRELFRAKISAYSATTFEARVIFLHDVEMCLERLQDFDRQIIARVCLQEYDHEAAARILQCTRRTLLRRLPDLIDELSETFLKAGLLDRLPETNEKTV